MKLTNPRPLKKGDTICIVSPSAGLAELFPHRVEHGIGILKSLGFNIVIAPHALERSGWVSSSAHERADDLHRMFADKNIKAVMCTVGGNHANQILKYLDFDLIKRNPKIFIGYSDITILHYAFAQKAYLRTFYGPCLISEFGEYPKVFPYTLEYFKKALMDLRPIGPILSSDIWTDEFLDWFEKKDVERPRISHAHKGYEWWRQGSATGPIFGGSIPTINHLAGTDYWVDPRGTIFFIDIPEGAPGQPFPQSDLDAFLADLDNLNIFKQINGLIIGRPYQYGDEENTKLKKMIFSYTSGCNYPILYNTNIGHTTPIVTIPMGAATQIDSNNNLFEITESGFSFTFNIFFPK